MNLQKPELTRNLARAITSMVAENTQHRYDISVDIRQFNVDAATVLTIISLHDGQNQLTISTSTIHQVSRSTRGVVSATYRTNVGDVDEQFTQALDFSIDTNFIPEASLCLLKGVLKQWMNVSAQSRQELAVA